jgi:hypothetical protein
LSLERYNDHLLISQPRPEFHTGGSWCPFVLISWSDAGNRHVHLIDGLSELAFPTEEEAESYGLTIARAWVKEKT